MLCLPFCIYQQIMLFAYLVAEVMVSMKFSGIHCKQGMPISDPWTCMDHGYHLMGQQTQYLEIVLYRDVV
jgi:hypothetical protein